IEEWKQHEETIERFIQVIAKNMSLDGVTPSTGRLYGVLYFSEKPMTLDDMRDALEMSKTSMSTGVRTLSEMKMVESTFKKGVRKDLYQSDEDWTKSVTSRLGNRSRKRTETNIGYAKQAIDKLAKLGSTTKDESSKKKIDNDRELFDYAKNYYTWLMRFIHGIECG